MYDVLEELNKTSGVTGSMVVGEDGIVIAANLDANHEDETVGALASSIAAVVRKSMDRLQRDPFAQVTIEADTGKMFLADAGLGMLVVTTEEQANIGLIRLEINHAINRLQQAS